MRIRSSDHLLLALIPCLCLAFDHRATTAEEGGGSGWRAVGWGGGSFYFAAAWHQTRPDVVYLGGDCAGAYRSEDKGLTWRFANRGIRNYGVYCLAVSPAAPEMVYNLNDGGLCRSIDGARSWERIPDSVEGRLDIRSARSRSIRAVAVDPVDAQVVYAGSRTGKLFKTVDGGSSWRELPYLDAAPAAPSPAFIGAGALVVTYGADAGGPDSMGRISRVISAEESGRDWSAYRKLSIRFRLPEGAPTVQAALAVQSGDSWRWRQGAWADGAAGAWTEASLDLADVSDMDALHMVHVVLRSPQAPWHGEVLVDALAMHADAAGTLTAGQAPAAEVAVLGADWERPGDVDGWAANREFKDSLHVTAVRQSSATRGGGVLSSVCVAPTDAALVFAVNDRHGVFRSDDAGATWTALDAPEDAVQATVSFADADEVWAACGASGLGVSKDRGRTWNVIHPPQSEKVGMREVALSPGDRDRLYAIGNVGWGGFLFRSDDRGATWTRMANGVRKGAPGDPTLPDEPASLSTVTNIAVNPRDADELLISANWRNVFSGDGGATLEERSTGADNTCATDIQFAGGRTYVTAMDEGLLVSDDGGGAWRQLIPLKYDADTSGHFWRVRVSTAGDATRIVTTASPWDASRVNRAYVSEDGGATFALAKAGLPDYVPNVNCMWGRSYARSLASDPRDPAVLYLGMDGDPEPARGLPGGGIFRSADGGRTWTRCAGQPGGLRLYYGLVVDPTDSKRLFFSSCGTGGGAWRSEDAGATWQHVFTAESWCFNLEVSPTGVVLVGGKDLHRSADHGATWTKITAFTGAPTIVGIAVDPADERRMWVSRTTWDGSDDGGIHRTVDGGATWTDITGDIPYRKPQLLRYDPASRHLWAGGVGLFKIAQ